MSNVVVDLGYGIPRDTPYNPPRQRLTTAEAALLRRVRNSTPRVATGTALATCPHLQRPPPRAPHTQNKTDRTQPACLAGH